MMLSKPGEDSVSNLGSRSIQTTHTRVIVRAVIMVTRSIPVGLQDIVCPRCDLRITENSRLATAAPAIKRRITTRNSVRELFPLPPLARRSSDELLEAAVIVPCRLVSVALPESQWAKIEGWWLRGGSLLSLLRPQRATFWRGQFGASIVQTA
jgi:hypothetical protein